MKGCELPTAVECLTNRVWRNTAMRPTSSMQFRKPSEGRTGDSSHFGRYSTSTGRARHPAEQLPQTVARRILHHCELPGKRQRHLSHAHEVAALQIQRFELHSLNEALHILLLLQGVHVKSAFGLREEVEDFKGLHRRATRGSRRPHFVSIEKLGTDIGFGPLGHELQWKAKRLIELGKRHLHRTAEASSCPWPWSRPPTSSRVILRQPAVDSPSTGNGERGHLEVFAWNNFGAVHGRRLRHSTLCGRAFHITWDHSFLKLGRIAATHGNQEIDA
mmetsp:Transcript_56126/g.149775  ORF Transcript_56126/g.149775 Transcript_56126/m.149775 type:complete len:275 (+) Transcript_56126:2359-3183(+)